MQRDVLFLLPPGFEDNNRREYCPECAEMWGVLSYYPAIKESLEIRYVGIQHPRAPICDLLGEGKWNAPTLVLAPEAKSGDNPGVKSLNGHAFYDSARTIAQYFSHKYGIAVPRGS